MLCKLGLRRAQAISVVNVAFVLTFYGEYVSDATITLGCVAPTIVFASTVMNYLRGKKLDGEVCDEAGRLANQDASPIRDIRGSAQSRHDTRAALVSQGLQRIAAGTQADGWPATPGGWYPFNGIVDEASLYARALTASEVTSLFQAGSAGKCAPSTDREVQRFRGAAERIA